MNLSEDEEDNEATEVLENRYPSPIQSESESEEEQKVPSGPPTPIEEPVQLLPQKDNSNKPGSSKILLRYESMSN